MPAEPDETIMVHLEPKGFFWTQVRVEARALNLLLPEVTSSNVGLRVEVSHLIVPVASG